MWCYTTNLHLLHLTGSLLPTCRNQNIPGLPSSSMHCKTGLLQSPWNKATAVLLPAACLGTCSWELHVVTLCIGSNFKVGLKNRASEIWYCLNLLLSSHLVTSAHTEVGYILCFANHTALGMNVHISLKKKKPAWISCKVNHYTGRISFQTRHHQVHWDDW